MPPEASSQQHFQLGQTFFGLSSKDRPRLHEELYDLLWAGEGRWDWDFLYSLPIHLRKFYIRKINKRTDDMEAAKAQQASVKDNTKDPIDKPGV